MLILLPPSEGKSSDPGSGVFQELEPGLVAEVQGVLRYLRSLNAVDRGKVYGQKDAGKAAAIHVKNRAVLNAPCMKALRRYTGVVYANLDPASLSGKRRAESRICIVSALFGLVRGGTRIPDYKLPVNTRLSGYWRAINGERLRRFAKGRPVLSLLPQAYSRALEYDPLIRVDFRTAGGKKSSGHFGKAIKGRFVRFLVENDVTSPDGFGEFREDGYRFDGTNFIQR